MLNRDLLKNKIFLRYISIMVLVMIIPLSVGCIAMGVTVKEAKKQVTESSYSALCHTQRGLTREFDNIRQFALDLALDPELYDFSYDIESSASIKQLQNLTKKIDIRETLKQFVSGIYVYVDNGDIIIADGAKYDIRQFYEEMVAPAGESLEEWQERMKSSHYNKYRYNVDGDENTFEFLQSFPVAGKTKGNIVVSIDYDKLTEYYGGIYNNNSALYVLSSDKTVIYSIGSDRYPLKDKYITMNETSSTSWLSSKIAFKASGSEYTFISIEDSGAVSSGLQKIILFDVFCIILFVILGILSSMYAAYRISKPVLELKAIMGNYYDIKESSELADINEKLVTILEGNKNAEVIMNEQKQIIKNNLLKRLVDGNLVSEDISRELKEAGITFENSAYQVVAVDIDSRNNYDMKTSALTKYAIIKIITEAFDGVCHVEIIDNDWKELILILNLDNEQSLNEQIYNCMMSVDEFISKELSVDVEINIGDVYSDMHEIYRSYLEAKECSEYRMYSGTGRVLAYSKIKNKERGYFYNAEQENEFIRCVIMGNERAAIDCLDKMISIHKNGSVAVLRCFFFNLLGTMLKILNSGNIDVAKDVDDNLGHFDELFNCKNLDELQSVIRRIVEEICRDINMHGNNKKQNLRRAMLEYIENNYCDNTMSLERIADEFNLNFTYISHFFKEQIGENFIDYITRLRIEKAKELLTDTEYTIAEVAVKVGYANSAVLIKNFKKVENTTPGKFRESTQNK